MKVRERLGSNSQRAATPRSRSWICAGMSCTMAGGTTDAWMYLPRSSSRRARGGRTHGHGTGRRTTAVRSRVPLRSSSEGRSIVCRRPRRSSSCSRLVTRPRASSELRLDVLEHALENRLSVAVHPVPTPVPRPVGMEMAEEAALGVGLDAEHVPVPVAEGGDVVRRPARVPWVACVAALVIDVAEDDLVVLDELPEQSLLPAPRQEELPLRVRGDERDHASLPQPPGERARAALLEPEEARAALVVTGVVRREDGLGLRGHRPLETGEEARLHEHLEAVAHAKHRLARLDELDEVHRELRPNPCGEDRPRAHVVAGGEAAGHHEDVVLLEASTQVRRRVPRELLEMDLLRAGPEMAEVRDGLLLAVRPLDEDDPDAHVLAPHETTTCRGIASVQAFRMTATPADSRLPRPRTVSERPPTRPSSVVGTLSMMCANASSFPRRTSTSHRPFDSEKSCASQRIGSIASVRRSAPTSPPRHISAAAIPSPPWLRSWQAATVPARIAPRRWSIATPRAAGSTEGTVPPGAPRRRAYSDPPSSSNVRPTRTTAFPDRLKSVVTHRRRSSA